MNGTFDDILPPDALQGVCVGVSVSETPDLARLGLMEGHFRLALGEIARSILGLGGKLAYGGHLDPQGYTAFLLSELQRGSRRDRPLLICLAWTVHRQMAVKELVRQKKDIGLYGELVCLDPQGVPIGCTDGRGDDPIKEKDPSVQAQSLTAMRDYMGRNIQGRVLIGGKRHGFQGAMPGLLEEARMAIDTPQPLFLAGGFGGITLDVIRALKPQDASWAPIHRAAPPEDPRCTAALAELTARASSGNWPGLGNGLSEEENRRLAATHRPSDIAVLVSLGLGRLARQGRF